MEKGEIAQSEQFHFFHNVFYEICTLNPVIATFQLSSAGCLNLGWSQNGVLGNGLTLYQPHIREFNPLPHNAAF